MAVFDHGRPVLCLGSVAFLCLGCGTEDPASSSASTGGAGGQTSGAGGQTSGAGSAQIVINELVASNVTGAKDSEGGTGDWIELYNLEEFAVDLVGYFISDNGKQPTKAELVTGAVDLVVPPHGVLMLWADSDSDTQGNNHLPFNLAKEGEGVWLFSPARKLLDSIEYVSAPSDYAYARFPDGTGPFVWCATPTPNVLNGAACPGGVAGTGNGGAGGQASVSTGGGTPLAGAGGSTAGSGG